MCLSKRPRRSTRAPPLQAPLRLCSPLLSVHKAPARSHLGVRSGALLLRRGAKLGAVNRSDGLTFVFAVLVSRAHGVLYIDQLHVHHALIGVGVGVVLFTQPA